MPLDAAVLLEHRGHYMCIQAKGLSANRIGVHGLKGMVSSVAG
jgi:hypothetical protein